MKKLKAFILKNKVWIIITLLIAGWFSWFQLRPTYIRKSCYSQATYQQGFHEFVYMDCLLKAGFPPNQIVAR